MDAYILSVENVDKTEHKIKLFQLWMRDMGGEDTEPNPYVITYGLWETTALEHSTHGKLYTLTCVYSGHPNVKIGDTRCMREELILQFCHRVEITHLPKV